ncbi:MAG: zinc-finger domain-containing protein [Burkholderiales bacterium]|nr:zinc-finger domain-containing protein [Burkholderiales bacterium]
MRQAEPKDVPLVVELTAHDLPAYCPNPRMPIWSWHPRVFLDVVNEPEAMCPYCGTRYRLGAGVRDGDFDTLGLHQHHRAPPLEPETQTSAGGQASPPEAPNLHADARGSTTLEQITRWLTRRGSA